VIKPFPVGTPDDAARVERPDREDVVRRIEGEAGDVSAHRVSQPEIVGRLEVEAADCDALVVRREPERKSSIDSLKRPGLSATVIHPDQLVKPPRGVRIKDQHTIVRDGKISVWIDPVTPNCADLLSNGERFASKLSHGGIEGLRH